MSNDLDLEEDLRAVLRMLQFAKLKLMGLNMAAVAIQFDPIIREVCDELGIDEPDIVLGAGAAAFGPPIGNA